MKRWFALALAAASGILLGAGCASARDWPMVASKECSAEHFHVNDLVSYAESREQRLPNASTN